MSAARGLWPRWPCGGYARPLAWRQRRGRGLAASRAGWQDWFAALAAACAVLAGVVLALARGQRRAPARATAR